MRPRFRAVLGVQVLEQDADDAGRRVVWTRLFIVKFGTSSGYVTALVADALAARSAPLPPVSSMIFSTPSPSVSSMAIAPAFSAGGSRP
jgi:hypothetical protein